MSLKNGVADTPIQHEEEDPVQLAHEEEEDPVQLAHEEEEDPDTTVQDEEDRPKFQKKKKMTEVEKLKISSKEFDDQNLPRLRSQKNSLNPFYTCSSLSSWNSLPVTRVASVSGDQSGSVGRDMLCSSEVFEEDNDTYDNYDYDEIIFMI